MTTGEKIKARRKELKMTTEELGKKIGVQRSAISKYETGRVDLQSKQLQKIAQALDISPVLLLPDPDTSELDKLLTAYQKADEPIKAIVRRILDI